MFDFDDLLSEVNELLVDLIPKISMWSEADDSEGIESDDDTRYLEFTVGYTVKEDGFNWSYQTGDNSYTGGAYGHEEPWLVIKIYPGDEPRAVTDRLRDCYNSIF